MPELGATGGCIPRVSLGTREPRDWDDTSGRRMKSGRVGAARHTASGALTRCRTG